MKSLSRIVVALTFVLLPPFAYAEIVNINEADADALAYYLSGIGEAKAETIVEYRTKHGSFKSIDDLVEVPGIGSKTVDANRENLSVEKGVISVEKVNKDS